MMSRVGGIKAFVRSNVRDNIVFVELVEGRHKSGDGEGLNVGVIEDRSKERIGGRRSKTQFMPGLDYVVPALSAPQKFVDHLGGTDLTTRKH